MSVVVFADPGPSAPPPGQQQQTLNTWIGWNGDTFTMTPDNGIWLDVGVRGYGLPDLTHFKRTPVSVNGSVWYGYIIPERSVFWPLHMDFDEDLDRRFWRTMLPYQTGTWQVQSASGQTRSLDLRITDDGQWAPEQDPFMLRHATYAITLAAEQPLWRGDRQVTTFPPPNVGLFFGGGDPSLAGTAAEKGNLFISSLFNYDNAQLTNEGDVEAWLKYAIDGPTSSTSPSMIGLGSDLIQIPFAIPAGQRLTIDTNPTVQRAYMGTPDPDDEVGLLGTPTDMTTSLGTVTWSFLPPGETVNVSITVSGTPTAISVAYTPLYLRAW